MKGELGLTAGIGVLPEVDVIAAAWAAAGVKHPVPEVCRTLLLAQMAAPMDEAGWRGAATLVGLALEAVTPEDRAEPEAEPEETVAFAQMAAAFDRKDDEPKPFSIQTYFDVTQAVVRVNGDVIGTLSFLDLFREDATASDEDAAEPSTEPEPAETPATGEPESAGRATLLPLSDRQIVKGDDGLWYVSVTQSAGYRDFVELPADAGLDLLGHAAPAEPEPILIEDDDTPAEGGVPTEPEPVAEAAQPDWLALIDRVEAGESIASVARSGGVDARTLGAKVTARRRLLKPAGPDAAAIPDPEPAPVEPAAAPAPVAPEAEDEDPPSEDGDAWTAKDDLQLATLMFSGQGIKHAAAKMRRDKAACIQRYNELMPRPGSAAQAALVKRLNAQMKAEADHVA